MIYYQKLETLLEIHNNKLYNNFVLNNTINIDTRVR